MIPWLLNLFHAHREAASWRARFAEERQRRLAAESAANERLKQLVEIRCELNEVRHDLSNARKLLGYRRDVANAGMN